MWCYVEKPDGDSKGSDGKKWEMCGYGGSCGNGGKVTWCKEEIPPPV